MPKAFTKVIDTDDDAEEASALPEGQKNYVTPAGLQTLREEWRKLFYDERPQVVQVVSCAAGNGDRSENGDYIYGRKRLREIDRRVRYLLKRMDNAVVVDPKLQRHLDQVFFGAQVEFARANGATQKVQIVGIDEASVADDKISWLSPIARALMKSRVSDQVNLRTPAGLEMLEVLSISYGV